MPFFNKGISWIKYNLWYIIGFFILILVIILFYIANNPVIEEFESIPKFEYTPQNVDCVSQTTSENYVPLDTYSNFIFSSFNYPAINLVPYSSDMSIQQLLERNTNKFKVDCTTKVVYTVGADGKTYAFGTSDNPVKFIATTTEPTTFIQSVGLLLQGLANNEINAPECSVFFEYDSILQAVGTITITVKQPEKEETTPPSTTVTVQTIQDEFSKDGGKYRAGACYITAQKYGLNPWVTWGSTPQQLRSYWSATAGDTSNKWRLPGYNSYRGLPYPYNKYVRDNPIGNYCGQIVRFNSQIGKNSHDEYVDKFMKFKANYTKIFKIKLIDNKAFEQKIIDKLLKETYNLDYNADQYTGMKITYPDKTIVDGKYTVDIKTADGKTDTINVLLSDVLEPIISQLYTDLGIDINNKESVENHFQDIFKLFDTNIQTLLNITNGANVPLYSSDGTENLKYMSGYVMHNNNQYPIIVRTN